MPLVSGAISGLPLALSLNEALVLLARAEDILSGLPAERLALPPEEDARIARYKNADDQHARRAAHGLVRHCLGHFLGRPPRDLHFTRDEKGRPFLNDAEGIDFNLSHGGRWIAVGISRAGRIGVDVQDGSEAFDWKAVSRAFLHENEIADLHQLDLAEQAPAALELWCLKEAFLKASGEGLSTPPHRLRPLRHNEEWRLPHRGYDMKAASVFLPDAACAAWASELAAVPRVIRI
jgi:4'-phosphopantetheinyl transferase